MQHELVGCTGCVMERRLHQTLLRLAVGCSQARALAILPDRAAAHLKPGRHTAFLERSEHRHAAGLPTGVAISALVEGEAPSGG
eukprot:7379557-Prymnesium_polylepis.4